MEENGWTRAAILAAITHSINRSADARWDWYNVPYIGEDCSEWRIGRLRSRSRSRSSAARRRFGKRLGISNGLQFDGPEIDRFRARF
jgi:hypothetical protein